MTGHGRLTGRLRRGLAVALGADGPRTPAVRQGEHSECGLAALAILMGHHGVHVPVSELRAQAGSTLLGTTLVGLRDLARRYGFAVSVYRAEPGNLARAGLPLIVHHRFIHFVVVETIGPETVRLNDPVGGPVIVPAAVFAEDFTSFALRLERSPGTPLRGRRFNALARYHARLGSTAIPVAAGSALVALAAAALATGTIVLAHATAGGSLYLLPVGTGLVVAGLAADAGIRRVVPSLLARRSAAVAERGVGEAIALPRHVVLGQGPSPLQRRLAAPLALAEDRPVLASYAALSWFVATAAAVVVEPIAGGVLAVAQFAQLVLVLAVRLRRGSPSRKFGEGRLPVRTLGYGIHADPDPWRIGGRGEALFRTVAGLHALEAAVALRAAVGGARLDFAVHAVDLAKVVLLAGLLMQAREGGTAPAAAGALALAGLAGLASLDLARIRRGLSITRIEHALHAVEDGSKALSAAAVARDAEDGLILDGLILDGVSWHPSPAFDPVVQQIDARVGPGEILAIDGKAGSGRTTLARLAAGWLAPSAGRATFGGVATTHLPDGTAIFLDGAVPLRTGTLRDVLCWGADIPDRDLAAALAAVDLSEVVASRGGLEQPVDRDRPRFSGGELARLGIARALCRRPRLLVVDSILDSVETGLAADIARHIAGCGITLVLVSNRRETVAVADAILRLPAKVTLR